MVPVISDLKASRSKPSGLDTLDFGQIKALLRRGLKLATLDSGQKKAIFLHSIHIPDICPTGSYC